MTIMEKLNINRNLQIFGEAAKKIRKCSGDSCGDGCHSITPSGGSSLERIRFAFKPDGGI